MNVLSIPALGGGASHLIPLYVLHQRYFSRMDNWQNYFLLPQEQHQRFRQAGVDVLPINYHLAVRKQELDVSRHAPQLMELERKAFLRSRPDIILEDNSFSTPLIAEKNQVPRISIHRTGFFRSLPSEQKNPNHIHSLEKGFEEDRWFDASCILQPGRQAHSDRGNSDTQRLQAYLSPKTKLIPGIPSIEVLPEDVPNRSSYFYTGPLTVEDHPSSVLQQELNAFFAANQGRYKALVTLGLIDRTNVSCFITDLLKRGFAVVSTVRTQPCSKYATRYFYNSFLPLHYICSQVDLVVHQCGSGMYHYPILNEKPAITLGTRCYDREDVAVRLQQLGVARHVPHFRDNPQFFSIFQEHVVRFEEGRLIDFNQLKKLKQEIYQTMLDFDMEQVIEYTLN